MKRKLTLQGQLDKMKPTPPQEPIPPRRNAGWRQEVYIQTATHGVFHTDDFVTDSHYIDGVPVWTATNVGLNLAFEGIGFRGDPFHPESRQYCLMEDALYRREDGGNWVSVLTLAQATAIVGGDVALAEFGLNGLNCNINIEGWVGVLMRAVNLAHTHYKLVLLYSTDFGATWNESIIEDWNISARGHVFSLTVGAYIGTSPYPAGQVMYCGVDATPRLAVTLDGGATWNYGAILGAASHTCHILVDPNDQSRVFAGLRNGVGPWHVTVSLDHGATINDYDLNGSEPMGAPLGATYYHLSVAMDERKMVRVGASTVAQHIHTTRDDGGSWEEPTPQYSADHLGISLVQDSPNYLYLLRQWSGTVATPPQTCHVVFASEDEGRTMTLKSGANACVINTGGGDSIPYNCGGVRGILEVWTDLASGDIPGVPSERDIGQFGGSVSWPQLEDRVGTGAEQVASGPAFAAHVAQEPFDAHLNNPACRVYNDANLPTLTGVLTVLTFNSERYDTDAMHSILANTNRITFNVAGIYHVVAQMNWETQTPPVGRRFAGIRLNGVTYIAQFEVAAEVADGRYNISFSTQYEFAATDWAEVVVFQSSGGALNIRSDANWSPEFSAARIA